MAPHAEEHASSKEDTLDSTSLDPSIPRVKASHASGLDTEPSPNQTPLPLHSKPAAPSTPSEPLVHPLPHIPPAPSDPSPHLAEPLSTLVLTSPLLQVRTGKVQHRVFGLPLDSAIHKAPRPGRVAVGRLGVAGDQQAYHTHGGPDKAVLCYYAGHYPAWAREMRDAGEVAFRQVGPGGFGENFVVGGELGSGLNERNVCIGDVYSVGAEGMPEEEKLLIQVTEPRAPCFKLNHRFAVREMSRFAQERRRTGWYNRVLRDGTAGAGDTIRLLKRPWPEWTVARVQHFLYSEMRNWDAIREISELPELADETRELLKTRLRKGAVEAQNWRLAGGEDDAVKGWSEYRIVEKRRETKSGRIASFRLEAVVKEKAVKKVLPGSHVRVNLDGGKLMRAYSVVGGNSNEFELGVALEEHSRGGSRWLHEKAAVGDRIKVGPITPSFPLVTEADRHVLIAGGIGITAFIAAAEYLEDVRESYHLHFAVRSADDVPFKRYLDRLGANLTIYDKSKGERMRVDDIIARTNDHTHVYCCGPQALMDGVVAAAEANGLRTENVHFEAFDVSTTGDPFEAELSLSKMTIAVPADKTLLDVLREAGIDIPSSCETGNCGTCRVNVSAGRVDHRGTGLLEVEKEVAMLSCVSRGIGTVRLEL